MHRSSQKLTNAGSAPVTPCARWKAAHSPESACEPAMRSRVSALRIARLPDASETSPPADTGTSTTEAVDAGIGAAGSAPTSENLTEMPRMVCRAAAAAPRSGGTVTAAEAGRAGCRATRGVTWVGHKDVITVCTQL